MLSFGIDAFDQMTNFAVQFLVCRMGDGVFDRINNVSRYNDFRRWADGRPLWVASRPDRYDTLGEERGCTELAKFIFTTLSHFSARQFESGDSLPASNIINAIENSVAHPADRNLYGEVRHLIESVDAKRYSGCVRYNPTPA